MMQRVGLSRCSTDVQSEPETSNVDEKYLQIPEINQPVVAEFCENAGIKDADSVDERIQKVYSYFWDNYPYTLHPGATPAREDYVNYFLQTTRKGLCANYATAGTLILRYMGIPSRYVEGYVIDYSDVVEAEILDSTDFSYDDYYNGDSELGRTAVVQVNVTDGAAHAWIEAFIGGRWLNLHLRQVRTRMKILRISGADSATGWQAGMTETRLGLEVRTRCRFHLIDTCGYYM